MVIDGEKGKMGEWPPCGAVERYQLSLCFPTACSALTLSHMSLSLMFPVQVSVLLGSSHLATREIGFPKANPTKGK